MKNKCRDERRNRPSRGLQCRIFPVFSHTAEQTTVYLSLPFSRGNARNHTIIRTTFNDTPAIRHEVRESHGVVIFREIKPSVKRAFPGRDN